MVRRLGSHSVLRIRRNLISAYCPKICFTFFIKTLKRNQCIHILRNIIKLATQYKKLEIISCPHANHCICIVPNVIELVVFNYNYYYIINHNCVSIMSVVHRANSAIDRHRISPQKKSNKKWRHSAVKMYAHCTYNAADDNYMLRRTSCKRMQRCNVLAFGCTHASGRDNWSSNVSCCTVKIDSQVSRYYGLDRTEYTYNFGKKRDSISRLFLPCAENDEW